MEHSKDGIVLVPGVHDALSALIAVSAGLDTLFLSGAALHATRLGRPDIGLLTLSELVDATCRIKERTTCTLIVDADTGYGGIQNLARTVHLLERAGADLIQIEDQQGIKPTTQLLERPVAPAEEMEDRIKAALDARRCPRMKISARTDALPQHGLSAAIERACRYAEAGADFVFVQSIRTEEEASEVSQSLSPLCPLVIHLPDPQRGLGGGISHLGRAGFRFGLVPHLLFETSVTGLRAAIEKIPGTAPIPDLATILRGDMRL
jgi:PEP phosphonomutase and related enzymes